MPAQPKNVKLTTGQGVYENHTGKFHSEYPQDNGVFLEHAMTGCSLLIQSACNVLCGGITQNTCRDLSEADSYIWLLNETPGRRDNCDLVPEPYSLDSAENLVYGLMMARKFLGPTARIGHIVIWTAWAGKKRRFTELARFLGLLERFSFTGYAKWSDAARPDLAKAGEEKMVQLIGNDQLLAGDEWEAKRRARYSGHDYEHRLDELRYHFPAYFEQRDHYVPGDSARDQDIAQVFRNAVGPFAE